MATKEERVFEVESIEVRSGDGQAPVIAGYAVVFNGLSEVMTDARGRQFRERFAPGAFDRALASNPDVRALWNHNPDYPLGRVRNGTLQVRKDGTGIRFELTPPSTGWGAWAVDSIRRGDVNGVSFAFGTRKDGTSDTWEKPGSDGVALRTVLDADLYEVSPVTFPAYPQTSVGVRSVDVPDFDDESDGRAAGEIEDAQAGRAAVQAQERERRLRLLDLTFNTRG